MTEYSEGRHAPGWCQRCQFKWPLAKLQRQVVATKLTDLLVCPDCLDKDQPQWLVGKLKINDPQAIRRPAPPLETELSLLVPPVTPPNPNPGGGGGGGGGGAFLDSGFILDGSAPT